MDTVALLNKWRHLIEPETSRGITPVRWDDVLATPVIIYEAANSVLVVRDVRLPGRRARSIWVAAGDLGEVLGLVKRLEDDSRRAGISAIVFMGRRGWIRAAQGYTELQTVGMKEL